MQLKIYKFSEFAKLEWIHYQTALDREKKGKYVKVAYYNSTVGKDTSRYLPKSDSDIILVNFNSLEAKKAEIRKGSCISSLESHSRTWGESKRGIRFFTCSKRNLSFSRSFWKGICSGICGSAKRFWVSVCGENCSCSERTWYSAFTFMEVSYRSWLLISLVSIPITLCTDKKFHRQW